MKPQNYFPENYLKDLSHFESLGVGDHLCGRTYSELFKNTDKLEFVNLNNFIICLYELNLINQVIFSHFKSDFSLWKEVAPKMIDNRCTYISHPIDILTFAEKESKNAGNPIIFTHQEILSWDLHFKKYIEKLCKENHFETLSPEKLFEAIKNDPDCNNTAVRNYFASMN